MTNKELLESYKKGLKLALQEIKLHKDYFEKHGEYICEGGKEIIATQEDNAIYYREKISELEELMHKSGAEAVKLMIDYAKSEETEPSEALKKAVNVYLSDCYANNGHTREDNVERREIALAGLIIGCIYKCDHYELKKLDRAKELLAENF